MREYSIEIPLGEGMVPYRNQANFGLRKIVNLQPTKEGLVNFEFQPALNSLFAIGTWPFPIIVRCCDDLIAFYGDHFEIAGSAYVGGPTFLAACKPQIPTVCDFGAYGVINTGYTYVILQKLQTGNIVTVAASQTGLPRTAGIMRYGNMLVGCGATNWQNLAEDNIIWSNPMSIDCRPVIHKSDDTSKAIRNIFGGGFLVIPEAKQVIHVAMLGEHIIAYTDVGIYILTADSKLSTFTVQHYSNDIIKIPLLVTAQDRHCFIIDGDEIVTLSTGDFGKIVVSRVSAKPFFDGIVNLNTAMLYAYHDFICISDSANTLVMTPGGFTTINCAAVQAIPYLNKTYIYYHKLPTLGWSLQCHEFNWGRSGYNTFQAFELGGEWEPDAGYVCDVFYSLAPTAIPVTLTKMEISPKGVAFPVSTGLRHQLLIEGTNREKIHLSYLTIKFKIADKHAQRGTYASASASQSNS